ncbi:CD109 antigen-like [Ruditapes philippinarum]|uniref:CD109 antigen-like n=1 Tax=Ruditapes philippinarum TaxID=129788 RepID=UPI00295BA36B|nr:CD109 antigen-like [Ruditapes philippinarum]
MLLQASFLLFFLSAATGTYVAYFPNLLIPGIPLKTRVLVQSRSLRVPVKVSLTFAGNDTLIARGFAYARTGEYTTIIVKVPSTLLPSNYRVHITGSNGHKFSNSTSILYDDRCLMVFIQTDKVRYSAGQTVKYRAVFLLPNLLDFQGYATIVIEDGGGNKIEALGPDIVKNGVISGDIELSRYPVFGTWKIVIEAMGRKHIQSFEVNEYVLPRFTVELTMPSEVKPTKPFFTIGVTARFTFQTDVKGDCVLLIYNEDKTSNNFKILKQIDGSVEFNVDMSVLTSKLDITSNIKVRAMVIDNSTALTMVAERKLNIASNEPKPVTLTKIDPYKNSYIPGMTYRTKIFVGRNGKSLGQSGTLKVTPTVTTAILELCTKANPPYKWVNVQTEIRRPFTIHFDSSGYADWTYDDNTKNVEKISFSVVFFDRTIQSKPVTLTFVIYPLPDNIPFLRMTVNKFKVKVGQSILLDVAATESLNGYLTFEVYARGMNLKSELVAVNGGSQMTHTMTVSKNMIPRAFIIVNHLTQTGQLIADYVYIEVEGNPFSNEVNSLFHVISKILIILRQIVATIYCSYDYFNVLYH